MYLDRHDLPGITPEELAEAHRQDEATQDGYGVRYHTYWFDPSNGSVFCLAEGPSREAIETVHRQAHGEVASAIIELDPAAPLNALFGEIHVTRRNGLYGTRNASDRVHRRMWLGGADAGAG